MARIVLAALAARSFAMATLILAALLPVLALPAHSEPLANVCKDRTYAPQTLDVTQPLNLGQLKNQLYFYACSGAYDSDLNKVLAAARTYVAARAAHVRKPAIVFDIDETSLSNLSLELVDDFAYIKGIPCTLDRDGRPEGPCGFDKWVALARAPAIDGTLALYGVAVKHHVAVFFITGRHENERAATEMNLKAAGYENWNGLVLRRAHDNMTVSQYKSGARAKIAEEGYTIIANVGDQESDLAGGYAERAYKLPNPFYYIP